MTEDTKLTDALQWANELTVRANDLQAALSAATKAKDPDCVAWHVRRAYRSADTAAPALARAIAAVKELSADLVKDRARALLILDGPMASQHPHARDYAPEPPDAA